MQQLKRTSDRNVVDRNTQLTDAIHELSLTQRGGDLTELPGARFGESSSGSQSAMPITHRSKVDIPPAHGGSQHVQTAPRAAASSQYASVVTGPQLNGHESGETKNVDSGALMNLRRRRTGSWLLGNLSYDDSQERLQDKLVRVMEQSSVDRHRKFIPEGQLSQLVTRTTVELELARCEQSLRKRLQIWRPPADMRDIQKEARIICGDIDRSRSTLDTENYKHARNDHREMRREYRKIFAILLLIDRPSRIRSFLETGICDNDLPLVKASRDPSKLEPTNASDTPLRCFKKWRGSTIARFEEQQWTVLAPIFKRLDGERVVHRELQRGRMLPFTSWEKAAPRGGFGQVYKAKIHPDHYCFHNAKVCILS
jgi:hypothetical protein